MTSIETLLFGRGIRSLKPGLLIYNEVGQDREHRTTRGALDAPPIRRLPSRGNPSPFTQRLTFFRCGPLGTLHPAG